MDKVIRLLLDAGFEETVPVTTPSGKISRISGNRFVATSINTRRKFKYPRGNMRVTVGSRTVSIYKVIDKKPCDFINYKTTDIESIKFTIKEIQNRF